MLFALLEPTCPGVEVSPISDSVHNRLARESSFLGRLARPPKAERRSSEMKISTSLALCLLVLLSGVSTLLGGDDKSFDETVAPILARRCLDCHSGSDPKGKLDLSQRSTAMAGGETGSTIVPGKPEESLLWEQLESDEMPPKSPLTPLEKSTIKAWIASGANWGTDPVDPYQATTHRRAGATGGLSSRFDQSLRRTSLNRDGLGRSSIGSYFRNSNPKGSSLSRRQTDAL